MDHNSGERQTKKEEMTPGEAEKGGFAEFAATLFTRASALYSGTRELLQKMRERTATNLEERLEPEMIHNPTDLLCQEIQRRGLAEGGIIAFGEDHYWSGTLEHETEMIKELSARELKPKMVFLEEFRSLQPLVNQYYKTGVMPPDLEDYLLHDNHRLNTLGGGHDYKLRLVQTCHDLGIPVMFIDNYLREEKRDNDWSEIIDEKIGANLDGLYILIAGANHASKTDQVYIDGQTITSQLAERYGLEKIISISTVTPDSTYRTTQPGATVENAFLGGLSRLGRSGQDSAVLVDSSPFRDEVFDNRQFPTREAYDILEVHPKGTYLLPWEKT